MLTFITARDHKLMQKVNGWRAPQWIRLWMVLATRGGDGWLWGMMGLVLLVFGGANGYAAVGAAGLAASAGIIVFQVLKRVFNRQRPCCIAAHCWATLLPPDQFSFPSGHSITAFAVATPMFLHFPGLTAGLLFCGLSVAVSRVMLGLHFLSDVLAGCALGFLLGYFAYLWF